MNKLLKATISGLAASIIGLTGFSAYRYYNFNKYLKNLNKELIQTTEKPGLLEKIRYRVKYAFNPYIEFKMNNPIPEEGDAKDIMLIVTQPLTIGKTKKNVASTFFWGGDGQDIKINLTRFKQDAQELKEFGEELEKKKWSLDLNTSPFNGVSCLKCYEGVKKKAKENNSDFFEEYFKTTLENKIHHELGHRNSTKEIIPTFRELAYAKNLTAIYCSFCRFIEDPSFPYHKSVSEILKILGGRNYSRERLLIASPEEIKSISKKIYTELKNKKNK